MVTVMRPMLKAEALTAQQGGLAGGVIPGAMNSQLAGLAVSLGGVGSQTSEYMFVIVGL